jgi:hypothetical protein
MVLTDGRLGKRSQEPVYADYFFRATPPRWHGVAEPGRDPGWVLIVLDMVQDREFPANEVVVYPGDVRLADIDISKRAPGVSGAAFHQW